MWKAAFQGRSEKGGEGSVAGKATKDESQLRRKKSSSHSHRAESVISNSSRRDDDRDRERRKSGRAGSIYDSGGSRYENGSSYTSSGPSQYVTAPSSRVEGPQALTASALRMLPDDEEEWEDDEKDARSERRSKKRGSGDEKRRKSARSEKERPRSHSTERKDKKKVSKSSEKSRDKDPERSRREPELVTEASRAIPVAGSFEQFPGQYARGQMGPPDPAMMSGALPSAAYQNQFPGQDPYARPQMPPSMPNRSDSYGHAADYYLDEGQSVQFQPGHRTSTPNMLVNPDLHLIAASAEANPAQDTGHGSAADFYGGTVSSVPYSHFPSTAPATPAKPSRIGKTSASAPSSSSKPKSKPSRSSTIRVAAAARAAGAEVAALSDSSHQHSQSQQYKTSSSSYQQGYNYTSKPTKPTRHQSEGSAYYAGPSSNSTYPPTLSSTNGFVPIPTTDIGPQGRQANNSSSNVPLYAAAAAGAAGLAAHEHYQHHNTHTNTTYNMASAGGYGGGGQGPPRAPRTGAGGAYYGTPDQSGGMAQMSFHEYKGPLTRLRDGLFNIISTPEDVAKMEMYTEYIGVCKHCFDPRTSAWDAPRVHHYHKRRDSFENMRRRTSGERLGRMGSSDSLRRQGSTRVDKDNRYYASDSSRRKRESGAGMLGAGLAAAGGLVAANALQGDRRDFDDTYSVKSGHRESSAVRRRSRSSSRDQLRQSQHGVIRPDREEWVTVRKKDGSIEKRRVSRKSRSTSRERKSTGLFGAAAAGAAVGAAGMAASLRRQRSRSSDRSPNVIGGLGAPVSRSRRSGRRSPSQSSYYDISRNDRPQESQGIFGGFFSPPKKAKKRRNSREHQKKRKGFFTFSNSSASSSNSDIAFGDVFASGSGLGLSRKSSVLSNRSAHRTSGRASRQKSDDQLAATVAGISATATALAAAQRGHRISKRTSRPELGRRRDVRHSHADSDDENWEDELPSDVDDSSSVEGGLAYGNEDDRRLAGRQSMESIASHSSAGGLGAWGWRWGGKDKKRRSRQNSSYQRLYDQSNVGSYAAPSLAGLAAGTGAAAAFDTSRPMRADKPIYLDDAGRPLPGPASASTASGPAVPMRYVDPAPIPDAGTPSTYSAMPGATDEGIPVSRPGPDILQAPQPISPAQPAFTQSPPDMRSPTNHRPGQPRRSNSSPTSGYFAQDAALIGGAALATAGAIAGISSISGRSGREKEPSRVSFGFTEEQQAKVDRERRREQKTADEERRRADRTRALKEEADRAAKESRQEDVRRQREEENRRAAELRLEKERVAQREAEEHAERERLKDQARSERERLEQEALDRQAAAIAAAVEVEKHRQARENAERRAELAERERREREDGYARDQARLAEEYERRRESEERNQYEAYAQRYPNQNLEDERKQWPSARQQMPQYSEQSPGKERKQPSRWGSAAVGAAAAATVGAVMTGREHEQERDRHQSRDDGYYDQGHQGHSEQQYRTAWEAREKNASPRDEQEEAELERRTSEKYGRRQSGVEIRGGYASSEIKPKNEHEGEPLVDDDIYDPNFFKKKHTPVENARYSEFARKAADKVVHDREHAYDDDKKTSYADFFAPKELLDKAAESKTRAVSPDGDMDMQVFHLRDAEVRSSYPASSDYGNGKSEQAPYGVPRLNVIAPTPPPGSAESSPLRSKEHTKSPLSREQVLELANELNKSTVPQSRSEKSERSRSISWGNDSTHYYDVNTPDSHQDHDSYIINPDVRIHRAATAAAGVAGVGAIGKALHEIVVEDPSGGERHYTEEEWLRDEERDAQAGAHDDKDFEDITPEPEPRVFYRQPFFDSVSDMGTSIFNVYSPRTEDAQPVSGFVEGETDEPTPIEEKKSRIPGDFDDDMDDIYRPRPERDNDPVAGEVEKQQPAAAVAGAAEEASSWEPPLTKKESNKREKEASRASSVVESEPTTYYTAEPVPVPGSVADPGWEPTLSRKEQKKREKAAKRQSVVEESKPPAFLPSTEPTSVADNPAWELPLSAKEKQKRYTVAKRSDMAESDPPTPAREPVSVPSPTTQVTVEPEEDYFLSKKDKKKRDKARKESRDLASSSNDLPSEPKPVDFLEETPRNQSAGDDWEALPSKKEQKKRDKDRSADAALAAVGITAATAILDRTESSTSGANKKNQKGKKSKLGEPSYDDPRDFSSELAIAPEPPVSEPHSMPGGWDSDRRNSDEKLPEEAKEQDSDDHLQYQTTDETSRAVEPETPAEDDRANFTSASKKSKKKKKNKRNSAAFNIPEVSSPLRSEIPLDDYVRTNDTEKDPEPYTNGHSKDSGSSRVQEPVSSKDDDRSNDKTSRKTGYFDEPRRRSDSPKQISPEDARSSASDERKSRREEARRGNEYFDEPSYAYETASIAATEPVADYEHSSKSKRRSRHADDDDDTRSVTSSRSRRDKEDSPPEKKKEKKGGLFGLFGRNKSTDDVKSYKDDTLLSRTSLRESKRDDEDDGSRHRRKHRSRSEYGNDDDDTRSVKSSSGKHRRHRSENVSDDDSRAHRTRSTHDDFERSSPPRSEPGHRHHRRRGTDDDGDSLSRRGSREPRGAASEGGSRHHDRRRTDEDAHGARSRDQSFLGMRVEEMPPLPVSRPASPSSAARQQREGSSAEAESGTGLVTGAAIAASLGAAVGAAFADRDRKDKAASPRDVRDENSDDEHHDRAAPTLEPGPMVETAARPVSTGRPSSSTAVPLHFPGRAPQTPLGAKDRAQSFSAPAVRSPATPVSPNITRSRQGRPQSTEIRPLYLVERNRQTPEVEDALPSLPSSKPSSRASSIQGGDETYQSAAEELDFDSPNRSRAATLTLDTDGANAYRNDSLGSGEVTPKASVFHGLPGSGEKAAKQEPQFYTWEDFAQDERLHEQESQPVEGVSAHPSLVQATPGLTMKHDELSSGRSKSPGKSSGAFKSAAAAAMLGTAVVYAHHRSQDHSPERLVNFAGRSAEFMPNYDYPLPAPVEESTRGRELTRELVSDLAPTLTQTASSKKTKDEKGKKQLWKNDEPTIEQPAKAETVTGIIASATPHVELNLVGAQDVEAFRETGGNRADKAPDAAASGVGTCSPDRQRTDALLETSARPAEVETKKEMDRFLPSAAAHTPSSYGEDFFSRASGESSGSTSGTGSGVATPFMAVPTPAGEGAERDIGEVSKENEQRPATSYKLPTAKAEPAPLVIEQRNVEAAEEQSTEPVSAPKLTRKQSKKSKKKGNAAMLWEEEPGEPASEQPLQLDTATKATGSRESRDAVGEPLTAIVMADTLDAQPWHTEVPSKTEHDHPAIQFSFGTNDFNQLAQSTAAGWQDSQAQAFHDSMISESASTASKAWEESGVESEGISFEASGSKKKTKKGKKNRSSNWSDAPDDPLERETPAPSERPNQPSQETAGIDTTMLVGLGAAAVAIGTGRTHENESKNKSKKDKRKSAASWTDIEEEPQLSPDSVIRNEPVKDDMEAQGPPGEQDNAFAPELDLRPVGPRDIVSSHNEDIKHSAEQVAVAASEFDLSAVGATVGDAFEQRAEPPQPSRETTTTTSAEDVIPTTSSKKGKKNKKNVSQTDVSEPVSRAESPSASREVSVDGSDFVDAEESQGPASPKEGVSAFERDATPTSKSETTFEKEVEVVTAKKSKKDKKKRKSAAFFEPEAGKLQESATPSASQSRRASADETTFVDAREQRVLSSGDVVPSTSVEPAIDSSQFAPGNSRDIQAAEIGKVQDSDIFAPVSGKKGKKNKKKQQRFEWASLDDAAPGAPEKPVTSHQRIDLGEVSARDITAIEDTRRPEQATTFRDEIELGPVGAQDTTAIDNSGATEESSYPHGHADLDLVGAQYTTANSASTTPEDFTASRDDIALGPIGAQDLSAFEEAALPTSDLESEAATNTVPTEPVDEIAPAKSSKKSKKDKAKKKAALDWDAPDLDAGASAPIPESHDGPLVESSYADATRSADQPEQVDVPFESLEQESKRDLADEASTVEPSTDDFAPVSASKKSKKDKKKRKSAVDWVEQDVETVAAVSESLGDGLESIIPAVIEQDDVHGSQSPAGEAVEADATALDLAQDDFTAPVSSKQAMKDRETEQQSAFAWADPDPEIQAAPQSAIAEDTRIEKGVVEHPQRSSEDTQSAQDIVLAADDQRPQMTEAAPEDGAFATKKRKKDKEKKKQALNRDDLESTSESLSAPGEEDANLAANDEVSKDKITVDSIEKIPPQPEERLISAPSEEQFKPTLSRKQSKKDKKKKLRQQLEDVTPEEQPVTTIDSTQKLQSRMEGFLRHDAKEGEIVEPVSTAPVEDPNGRLSQDVVESTIEPLVEASIGDEFRPHLSRKQSKKDERKKLRQSLGYLEPEAGGPSAVAAPDEASKTGTEQLGTSSHVAEEQIGGLAHSGDGKTAAGPGLIWADDPTSHRLSQSLDASHDESARGNTLDSSAPRHESAKLADEAEAEWSAASPQDEPLDKFLWASSSKKKKGKKHRQDQDGIPEEAIKDTTISAAVDESVASSSSGKHIEASEVPQEELSRDLIRETAPVSGDDLRDDSWAFTTSSKRKSTKNKNSTSSRVIVSPLEQFATEDSALAVHDLEAPDVQQDIPTDDQAHAMESEVFRSEHTASSSVPPADETVREDDDFTWASSSRKKGKKGRKGKKSEAVELETSTNQQVADQVTPTQATTGHEPGITQACDESVPTEEAIASTGPPVEDDLWEAPASKKKKVKKGKKSVSGRATPTTEPTEHIPEIERPIIGQVNESADVPVSGKGDGQVMDQRVETSTPVFEEQQTAGIEIDSAINVKTAQEEPQDFWGAPTSDWQKGKTKLLSGAATPLAEDVDSASSTQAADLAEPTDAPSTAHDFDPAPRGFTLETYDDLDNATQADDGYAKNHDGPAHDTFDDVWAEEEIATHEDTAAVQDLFNEPTEDARSSYAPGPKNGKKKKGKKGFATGLPPSNEVPEPDLSTERPSDPESQGVETETASNVKGTDEQGAAEAGPASKQDISQRKTKNDVVYVEQSEGIDAVGGATTAAESFIQEPEHIDDEDFWAAASGSKKRGKKNKKSKTQGPWADTPPADSIPNLTIDTASHEPVDPASSDNPKQSPADAEPVLEEVDTRALQQEETILDNLSPASKAGKKKGRKSKATQRDEFGETDQDVGLASTLLGGPSVLKKGPEFMATQNPSDSQDPTEAASSDVWAWPAEGKKGNEAKKAKQVLAWDEEVPPSTADNQILTTEPKQEPQTIDSAEHLEKTKIVGAAPSEALDVSKRTEEPSTAKQENTTLEEEAQLPVDRREAEERRPSSAPFVDENQTPTIESQESNAFLTTGKDKKRKKKAKARAFMAHDFESEQTSAVPTSADSAEPDHSMSIDAAAAATAALAGVVASQATDNLPEEDEWASFSTKKAKKDMRKTRESGTSTPAMDHAEPSVPADVEVKDFGAASKVKMDDEIAQAVNGKDSSRTPEEFCGHEVANEPVANLISPRSLGILKEQPETVGIVDNYTSTADTEDQNSNAKANTEREAADITGGHGSVRATPAEDPSATSPYRPSQDIDFTATVAAGLADSGFNPDVVINDPVFQRRASPPGTIAEADPDEVLSTTTLKRRKGKKSKKSTESSGSPTGDRVIFQCTETVPADDFNDAIAQSLQGTGFDPALLEKALASSTDQSPNDLTEDPDEFAFASSKRRKGKKGKRSQADQSSRSAVEQGVVSVATYAPTDLAKPSDQPLRELTKQNYTVKRDSSDDAPSNPLALDTQVAGTDMARPSVIHEETQPVNILSVGRDEMDMEEMDRQYKEYRKNKRKQKKLKGASRATGLSDNQESATEQSTMVSESEGLSATTTRDGILSPQSTLDETSRSLSAGSQPEIEAAPPAEAILSPSDAVPPHSVFGERVKRRIPPKSKPQERSLEDRQSSTDASTEPRPEFGTAGMAAVVAAAARERQVRKEAHEAVLAQANQESTWSFDALNDKNKPDDPRLSLKDDDHQPTRDSGYQEGTRSPHRASMTSREIPDIVHTSSSPRESHSKDNLRQRRSLDPLKLATSPDDSWEIKNPKRRSGDEQRHSFETHSRTPSAETPLKPTSKDRASYLFQSPPDGLASGGVQSSRSIDSHSGNPLTSQRLENHGYFKVTSPRSSESHPRGDFSSPRVMFSPDHASADPVRDRSAFSPGNGPLSPRLALDPIPEERPTSKRGKSKTDLGGPERIKAANRAETPQGMRAREQAHSPSARPSINVTQTESRTTSNPLSTDTLINRLSWPDVDEQTDTVDIDRHLGHRHSRPALPDPRSPSVVSNRSNNSGSHVKSPQELRSHSRASNRSSTPSLRRVSLSGDLRAASRRGDGSTTGSAVGARDSPKTIPFEAPPTPPPNDDELMTGSASRAMDMNDDVFQGYGDAQQSQVSPTRPPSVRKRQSMHITDLESQLGQLAAENRALREAREYADQTNDTARHVNGQALQESLAARDQELQQKDHEISVIKAMLQPLQEEVARLTEMNGGLTEANRNLVDDTNGRYATLQAEHAHAHEQWQSAAQELDGMRSEHGRVTSGMKDIVEAEIATALADKNAEILRLREQLDIAAEQIRALQVQIQSSKSSDFLCQRDEDYFDGSCQKLCQHVQQWVLRFSKLSDNRICRLSTDLNDDKIEARLDNAVLDGSDVDKLLGERVRRRDVFMSVVMTMVWEYVFTRYLFGMDREQRQKLKALEKLLAEVGPLRAVSHWRATTLTLLSKRPTFDKQCTLDTEAVCHEIFGVLCSLLPPPSNSEQQLLTSLQKVIRIAVDLAIEMRTQRAEYIMLPPLQPEYDTNGDLVRKVHFNASLMNERSGFFSSNEELAAEQAVVKIVLFPLVVKKGDDYGEGEEEIVVCPAQVLVQNDGGKGKKIVRVMSGAMEIDDPIRSRQSKHSLVSEAPGSVGF